MKIELSEKMQYPCTIINLISSQALTLLSYIPKLSTILLCFIFWRNITKKWPGGFWRSYGMLYRCGITTLFEWRKCHEWFWEEEDVYHSWKGVGISLTAPKYLHEVIYGYHMKRTLFKSCDNLPLFIERCNIKYIHYLH